MQEFNCFYRLINKQITSSRNFGISKVCNMDQEAKIFKPRGTQPDDFLTRSTARGRAWRTRRRSRQPYWKSAGLSCLFCVLVSNHYSSIVLFLWSSSTYNAHINKSGQDSHTKTFSELYQFRSRLEARSYQLLYNLPYKLLYNMLENICNTSHESISR